MPSTTPNYNLPYPINSDPVNVAGDIFNLANALDTYALPSLVDNNIVIQGVVATGETVLVGDPVYVQSVALVSGVEQYTISVAYNSNAGRYAVGIAQGSATQGGLVKVAVCGPLDIDLDTSAFNVGDILYVGPHTAPTYNLTSTVPQAPLYAQPIAMVLNKSAVSGRIQVIPAFPRWIRLESPQTWTGTQTFDSIIVADQPTLTNDNSAANTSFVQQELTRYAPLSANNNWIGNNSFIAGSISGTTAPVGTATNILASTEFVKNALDNRLPTYAALTGATFTGTVEAPNLITNVGPGTFRGDTFITLNTPISSTSSTPALVLLSVYTKTDPNSNLYIDFNINGIVKSGNCGVRIWLEDNSGNILMTACQSAGYNGQTDTVNVGSISGSWVVVPGTTGDFSRISVKYSNPYNTGTVTLSSDNVLSSLSVRESRPLTPTIITSN